MFLAVYNEMVQCSSLLLVCVGVVLLDAYCTKCLCFSRVTVMDDGHKLNSPFGLSGNGFRKPCNGTSPPCCTLL